MLLISLLFALALASDALIKELRRNCPLRTFPLKVESAERVFATRIASIPTKPGKEWYDLNDVHIRGNYYGTSEEADLRVHGLVRCLKIAHIINLVEIYDDLVSNEIKRKNELTNEGVVAAYNLEFSPTEERVKDAQSGNIELEFGLKGVWWSNSHMAYRMRISVNNVPHTEYYKTIEEASLAYDKLKVTSERRFDVQKTLNCRIFNLKEFCDEDLEDGISTFEDLFDLTPSRRRVAMETEDEESESEYMDEDETEEG
jgi:hypothetical protein